MLMDCYTVRAGYQTQPGLMTKHTESFYQKSVNSPIMGKYYYVGANHTLSILSCTGFHMVKVKFKKYCD